MSQNALRDLLSSPSGLGEIALANSLQTSLVAAPHPWAYVTKRFSQFDKNLALTSSQQTDGLTKWTGVVSCLNRAYYGTSSTTENAFLIGSWAKETRIRPPRDVDLYFLLPATVYHRFENRTDNKQSALLQEVRGKLLQTNPYSDVRGAGPVVLAAFQSYNVEVVPAFSLLEKGTYWVCDTKNGGSYKITRPLHEIDNLNAAEERCNNNIRPLVRMLKAWQANCTVPIKSFVLELLAEEFLDQSQWRTKNNFYYDWITRDFFVYLVGKSNSLILAPSTFDSIWLGDNWKSKAETALARSIKACEFEMGNKMLEAGDEWQKIFGPDVPRLV